MIRLNQVQRIFPLQGVPFFALRDVELEIRQGDFLSIMGPSGSGKSTLLHILGLHDSSWTGRYHFRDVAVHELDARKRFDLQKQNMGFVFQQYHLIDDLTIFENLEIPLSYRNVPKRDRDRIVDETLRKFRLDEKRGLYPSQLSGGQQQLVGIARALIARPAVILADEPTGNLHSDQGREIMELFRTLNRKEGVTIVQVTHSQDNAAFGSRVVRLADGRIVG